MKTLKLSDGTDVDPQNLPPRLYLVHLSGSAVEPRALDTFGAPVTFEPDGSTRIWGIDSTALHRTPAEAREFARAILWQRANEAQDRANEAFRLVKLDFPPTEQWTVHHPAPVVRPAPEGETVTVFSKPEGDA